MRKFNNGGFTLIEVILALAILGIIFISFLTMFSGSLIWIYKAGDKGEAYSMAQEDIERSILREDATDTDNLIIVFGDNEDEDDDNNIIIRGGLVESTKEVNLGSSSLVTFLPYVPTITLSRTYVSEGETNRVIQIVGKYTHFSKDNSKIQILNYDGTLVPGVDLISPNSVINIDDTNQELEFNLPISINAGYSVALLNNRYIIRVVTTNVEEVGTEYARAKFSIEQPKYIAAGNENVYISSNGIDWINRNTIPNFVSDIHINSIAGNTVNYIMAGDFGRLHFSLNNIGWYKSATGNGIQINDVFWSSDHRKYYSAGSDGSVYYSESGQQWFPLVISDSFNKSLNSINVQAFTDTSTVFTIVGEGIIIYKVDDGIWNTKDLGDIVLKSITSNKDRLVAVGYKMEVIDGVEKYTGIVMTYTNTNGWSSPYYLADNILYDISSTDSDSSLNKFIAAGNDGKIWSLSVDVDGNLIAGYKNISISDDNLVGLYRDGTIVIAVSDHGNIFYSGDNGQNYELVEELGIELKDVFGR